MANTSAMKNARIKPSIFNPPGSNVCVPLYAIKKPSRGTAASCALCARGAMQLGHPRHCWQSRAQTGLSGYASAAHPTLSGLRLVLLEDILGDERAGHGDGPTAIEGKVRDQRADLLGSNSVVERALEMALELLGAIERDEGCACDQAAIALRQSRPLPDIPVDHLLGQVDELGDNGADLVAGGRWRGRLDGHGHTFLEVRGS